MLVHPNIIKNSKKLLNSPHRFASDEFLKNIHTLNEQDLDTFDFGIIGLSDNGTILKYNDYETKLANRSKKETLGASFFEEVAPCTNVPLFSGLFFHGVQHNDLHAFVSYFFDFRMTPTHVWIHMYRCCKSKTNWILVQKKIQEQRVPTHED